MFILNFSAFQINSFTEMSGMERAASMQASSKRKSKLCDDTT